VADVHSPL